MATNHGVRGSNPFLPVFLIKFLERVKNDEDLLRKIVIFTTEKNILADSTYMHVLEGVKDDSNVILFKQELYEESNACHNALRLSLGCLWVESR